MAEPLFLPEELADTWAKIVVSDQTLNDIKARGWATFIDEIVFATLSIDIEVKSITGCNTIIPAGTEMVVKKSERSPHGYRFTLAHKEDEGLSPVTFDERNLIDGKYPFVVTQVLDPD